MLKNISNLEGVKKLSKDSQKVVGGARTRFCGGTGGIPITSPKDQCTGWGIQWYNGQCYACY